MPNAKRELSMRPRLCTGDVGSREVESVTSAGVSKHVAPEVDVVEPDLTRLCEEGAGPWWARSDTNVRDPEQACPERGGRKPG